MIRACVLIGVLGIVICGFNCPLRAGEPAPPPAAEGLAVRVLSPADGGIVKDKQVTLQVAIRLPAGETLKQVRVLLGGKPVPEVRGLIAGSSDAQATSL